MNIIKRHFSKSNLKFQKVWDSKDHNDEKDTGYMKRRLEQLRENAFPSSVDKNAGVPIDAIPYNKTELRKELLDIENNDKSNFEDKYQHEVSISKLPSFVNKHSRDIAMTKPWTGVESYVDSSKRMLNDFKKPLKLRKKLTKPISDRLNDARENVLDYKLSKFEEKSTKKKKIKDDDGWKDRYRERLIGPGIFLNDSFAAVDNSITSLADQKILDAQRRGEFKNLSRGKPLEDQFHLQENMFIDRTEFHLNKILKKQNAMPPWIEKQGGTELLITRFRENLDDDWRKFAVSSVKEKFPDYNSVELIDNLDHTENKDQFLKLGSKKWLGSRIEIFKTKINDLNDNIRGYNLQAPLASQKLYLNLDDELEKCYKRVAPTILESFKRHIINDSEGDKVGYGDISQRKNIYQQPSESLGSMFMGLFKKNDN